MRHLGHHLRYARKWLLLAAVSAPLCQISLCKTGINQAGLTAIEQFPTAFLNSLGSAFFQTLIQVLGVGNQFLFNSFFGGS